MGRQQVYSRVTPIQAYAYQHVTAAGSNQHVGKVGKGTFLGNIVVNQPGTSVTLTLMNGTDVFAIVTLVAGMPPLTYNLALDNGLNYTTSGTCDLTICYLDML